MSELRNQLIREACDFYNRHMRHTDDAPVLETDIEEELSSALPVSPDCRREIEACKRMTRRALSRRLGFRVGVSHRNNTVRMAWRYWGAAAMLVLLAGVGFLLVGQRFSSPSPRMQLLARCAADTTVTLPDGTRVDLQGGSSLSIADDFGRSSRVVAMSGQAFFDVATDSDRLFTVEAGQLHAVVHGTSFNVLAHPGQTVSEITVSSGCVEVKKAHGGHSFGRYRHGDQITYDASTSRESVGKVDVGDMTEWRSHEFHLTDATLPPFREKMRRYFGVEVTVAQGAISPSARINCSVTTTRPTVGNVMEAVCTIFGASYRQQGSRIIIYPANNI